MANLNQEVIETINNELDALGANAVEFSREVYAMHKACEGAMTYLECAVEVAQKHNLEMEDARHLVTAPLYESISRESQSLKLIPMEDRLEFIDV